VLAPELDSSPEEVNEMLVRRTFRWRPGILGDAGRAWHLQGLDLDPLDPDDEDQLMMLIEARQVELFDALGSGDEVIVDGEPFSPRLHLAMHQIVANQLLADDPPETWQTVQRLAGLGYDWHNIMHMIARVISDDMYGVQAAP
jgi:hypothetical protein